MNIVDYKVIMYENEFNEFYISFQWLINMKSE